MTARRTSLLTLCYNCQQLDLFSSNMPSVIVGTGIIGVATAYYLSQSTKEEIHIIEASPELFASASGNAAGFLARDVSHICCP